MDALSTQISSKKFSVVRKGYRPADVDRYLQKVGELVAKLEDELRVNRSRIEALEKQAKDVREADTVVQTAFLAAAESKAKLMAEAEAKAAQLIAEAEARAERLSQSTEEGAGVQAEALLIEARRKLDEAEQHARARRREAEREAAGIIEAARDRAGSGSPEHKPDTTEAGAELQRLMETLGALRKAAGREDEGGGSAAEAEAGVVLGSSEGSSDDRGV